MEGVVRRAEPSWQPPRHHLKYKGMMNILQLSYFGINFGGNYMSFDYLAKEEKYLRRERVKKQICKYLCSDKFSLILLGISVLLALYISLTGN